MLPEGVVVVETLPWRLRAPEIESLICVLTSADPDDRPSAEEILRFPP